MRLLSWLSQLIGGKPEKAPTALDIGRLMSQAVLEPCSPQNIDHFRACSHIPANARNLRAELLYVYIFLSLISVETTWRDNETFRLEIIKSFTYYICDAITHGDALEFDASLDTMEQRTSQYFQIYNQGAKALIEGLPFEFLVHIGVYRTDSLEYVQEGLHPRMYLELYFSNMLIDTTKLKQQMRKRYGI